MNKIIFLVLFCAILGSVGQLMFKLGSKPFDIIKVGLGLLLYGIATILFIYSLRFKELSILYPIIATSYIFVLILSVIFLKETLNLAKIVGSSGIILCVWLIVK
jgi:drug/metabolite transporter (DMT)-like permease